MNREEKRRNREERENSRTEKRRKGLNQVVESVDILFEMMKLVITSIFSGVLAM